MKILFVSHRFPYPPTSGSNLRAFNLIRHLARDHEVTVASIVRSAREEAEAGGIAAYCSRYLAARVYEPVQVLRMVARVPTPVPSSMGYFHSGRLGREIRALAARERFGLVIVHCSSVAHLVDGVRDVPKILDFVDMDSQKWLDYARFTRLPLAAGYWLEGSKLERAERSLARRFDLCTTITRAEWETLESYRTGAATDWFPNGVDNEYFSPTGEPYEDDTISFVGRMDYYPNVQCMAEFCANVLPRIRARRPNARLLIVGADPAAEVRKLAALDGVTVTGTVPDVRPYVRRSALMVAPLNLARGTQNKILEAMACGVPVVTSRVAAGGVDAVPREHFLVSDTPEEQAAAVLRILDDRAERDRLAVAGRERMLSHHDWGKVMTRVEGIVERCLSVHAARAASGTGIGPVSGADARSAGH